MYALCRANLVPLTPFGLAYLQSFKFSEADRETSSGTATACVCLPAVGMAMFHSLRYFSCDAATFIKLMARIHTLTQTLPSLAVARKPFPGIGCNGHGRFAMVLCLGCPSIPQVYL
jgi:hypothetical protein